MTNGEARALAQPVQSGSCIACGNRMTGSPESFVVATAEVGVTAPEGYSPQQVEALHPHKGGDKTAPPLVDRIADCLVEDHIALMRENERLRAALGQPDAAVAGGAEMTRDDIIRMAQEAGLTFVTEFGVASAPPEWIERFAALVAAAEREACAQIADEIGDDDEDCHAWTAADAIRARSQL